MEAAVSELSRLLEQCSADGMAARHRSAPAEGKDVKNEEAESKATSLEERQQHNKDITVLPPPCLSLVCEVVNFNVLNQESRLIEWYYT